MTNNTKEPTLPRGAFADILGALTSAVRAAEAVASTVRAKGYRPMPRRPALPPSLQKLAQLVARRDATTSPPAERRGVRPTRTDHAATLGTSLTNPEAFKKSCGRNTEHAMPT